MILKILNALKNPFVAVITIIVILVFALLVWGGKLNMVLHPNSSTEIQVGTFESHDKYGKKAEFEKSFVESKNPYVIEALTVFVSIEDDSASKIRTARERVVYTVSPIKNIVMDSSLFLERFTSRYAFDIQHWFGTEMEVLETDDSYNVKFTATKNEPRTVVTGAKYSFHLPFPDQRKALKEWVNLRSNEDIWSYANTDDYIRDLTIIIESKNLNIQPVGQECALRFSGGSPSKQGAHVSEDGKPEQRSLSAHWSYLMPGEEVGIFFTW